MSSAVAARSQADDAVDVVHDRGEGVVREPRPVDQHDPEITCRLHAHRIATTGARHQRGNPGTCHAVGLRTGRARRVGDRVEDPLRCAIRAHQRVVGTGHLVQRLGAAQLGAHDLDPGVRDAPGIGGSCSSAPLELGGRDDQLDPQHPHAGRQSRRGTRRDRRAAGRSRRR